MSSLARVGVLYYTRRICIGAPNAPARGWREGGGRHGGVGVYTLFLGEYLLSIPFILCTFSLGDSTTCKANRYYSLLSSIEKKALS